MQTVWQDIRFAARTLLKKPAFTVVAVLTLALGIGANSLIFSVINAVLLRPLPYRDPDGLVRLVQHRPNAPEGMPRRMPAISTDDLQELRPRTQTLSHVAGYRTATLTLTGREEPIRLSGASVSPALFPMLGAQPLMGRAFAEEEEKPGHSNVAILSYAAWQRYFGSDANLIGRTATFDGNGYSIIGVMPAGFEFPSTETLVWTPFVINPVVRVPGERLIEMVQTIARVKDGVTIQQAAAETNGIFRNFREQDAAFERQNPPPPFPNAPAAGGPGKSGVRGRGGAGGAAGSRGGGFFEQEANSTVELVRLQDELVGPVRPALLVLLVAVGFVLLIACANVANLLLARAASRQQEIAIRAALGAGRTRLIRQVLTESVLLAGFGGFLGTVLAFWGIPLVAALGPGNIPRLNEVNIDGLVLAFTLGVSILTGILFGLAPALRLSGAGRMQTLKEGAMYGASGFDLLRRNRTRSLLAVAEIALAMVLLIGAGLLIASFLNLSSVDPGYDPDGVLTFQVALPVARYPDTQRQIFYEQLLGNVRSVPGVEAAAVSNTLPLQPGMMRISVGIQGRPAPARPEEVVLGDIRIVSPEYLQAMGLELAAGRGFTEDDRAGQRPVVLINGTFAHRYFANEDPVGRRLSFTGPDAWEVVGIVEDVRHAGLDAEPQAELYLDYRQARSAMPRAPAAMFFALRTSGSPASIVSAVRTAVRQLDPEVAIDNVATMDQRVSGSVARPRFYATMLGLFAGVAAILASVGIYGVMAYSVTQRTREIGIRIALGAERREVLALVLRQGAVLTLTGMVAGLAGAYAVTRYLQNLLFGLDASDPATFAAVSILLALVATLACYIPARRATRIDPIVALRYE